MTEMLPHGLHYASRDGLTATHLDRLLADGGRYVAAMPRPERDVLEALLRFCIEGIEHWNLDDKMIGSTS